MPFTCTSAHVHLKNFITHSLLCAFVACVFVRVVCVCVCCVCVCVCVCVVCVYISYVL